ITEAARPKVEALDERPVTPVVESGAPKVGILDDGKPKIDIVDERTSGPSVGLVDEGEAPKVGLIEE
ncbi:MAG: hypothetical protein KC933_23740, partial [Myxococcales bacterium]|nr:hypothetical protein [Myxococcales bacterium]